MSKTIKLKEIQKSLKNNLKIPLIVVFKFSTEEEYDFIINKTSDLLTFYLNLEQKINYFSIRHLEGTMIRKILSSENFKKDKTSTFLSNFTHHYRHENIKFEEFKFLCRKESESNVIFIDNLFLFSRKSFWPYVKNSLLIEKVKQEKTTVLQDVSLLMHNLVNFSHPESEKTSFKHIITLQHNNVNVDKSKTMFINNIISSHSDVCINVKKNIETGDFEFVLEKTRIKI